MVLPIDGTALLQRNLSPLLVQRHTRCDGQVIGWQRPSQRRWTVHLIRSNPRDRDRGPDLNEREAVGFRVAVY